jgi:hypothetical protein
MGNMGFITIPTEQTTAFTDVILAVLALLTAVYISKKTTHRSSFRTRIWVGAFLFLALSAGVGAIAHGFEMHDGLNKSVWHVINFGLGMTVALFLVATSVDLTTIKIAKRFLPGMLGIAFIFFLVTVFIPGSFLVFIIYESIAMLIALGTYTGLSMRRRLNGASMIAIAILLTMIAAGVQASEAVHFTIIWEFDHNGLFHLIQMTALPLFAVGISKGMLKDIEPEDRRSPLPG